MQEFENSMCREWTQHLQRKLCFDSGKEEGCIPVKFLSRWYFPPTERCDVYDEKGCGFIRKKVLYTWTNIGHKTWTVCCWSIQQHSCYTQEVVWMRNFSSANDFVVAVRVFVATSARRARYKQTLTGCCKTSLWLFLPVIINGEGCYLAIFYHAKCL